MAPPIYWLGGEPLDELLGDLLGVLIPQEGPLLQPAIKVSHTRDIENNEVTYNFTYYPVLPQPHTLNPRVSSSCLLVFDTSYEPLATTIEPSAPVVYSTISSATASNNDDVFYTKILIKCVDSDSLNAIVSTKDGNQLLDSEYEAVLDCLTIGMCVWDIVS
ncbi:hypothetical protein DSO57_1011600 [Entomophthora muscae]|uniref:Uncharacterized protein n=1 Tax=Entomophthora muscae TaxID=34485 RepID=A0ACC2UFT2_9FUNG|nr:hypothetical protein DSO57_1011600 [Entomophthora muscae]